MIKRPGQIPTLAMTFEHETMPEVTCVQVAADSLSVTVAYMDHLGQARDVREFSVRENPELSGIVSFTYFDDVWDMDMVLALLEQVDANELIRPAKTPVWHFVQWQTTTPPDFRNLPETMRVAS